MLICWMRECNIGQPGSGNQPWGGVGVVGVVGGVGVVGLGWLGLGQPLAGSSGTGQGSMHQDWGIAQQGGVREMSMRGQGDVNGGSGRCQ